MTAYKRYVRIKESKSLLLTDLPFKPGQVVEVVVIAQNGDESEERIRDLQAVLSDTQSLPAARAMDDDEIVAEIDAFHTHNESRN